MAKRARKKITVVREHPRRIPISPSNPIGITIVDEHIRRLPGTYLDHKEIEIVFKNYDLKKLMFPTAGKLKQYKNADKYDTTIAIWTDYFSKKFEAATALDPDVVKALIASESGFRIDPPGNPIAIGIAQITKKTLKILQDPNGEAREFIFKKIRQKDLKNTDIAIPMAVRWLFRKRATAEAKLNRAPNTEELILEYKGLLRSSTKYKESALRSFKENYAKLKAK